MRFPIRKLAPFVQPASACRRQVFFQLAFRLSLLGIGLFVANGTGDIVTLLSAGASYGEILRAGWTLLGATGIAFSLLFAVIRLKGAWPHVESRMLREARRSVFAEYLGKEVSVSEATGKTLSLFENGIASWVRMASTLVIELPLNVLAFAAVFSYLVMTRPELIGIVLAYVTVIAAVMVSFQKVIEPLRKKRVSMFEGRSRTFVRSVMERRTVFMYGAVGDELSNLSKWEGRIEENGDALATIRVPLYRFPQFFLDAVRISVILVLAHFVAKGEAEIGSVVSASVAFGLLDKHFQGLVDSFQTFSDERTNFVRMRDFLDSLPNFERYRNGKTFVPGKGGISFENVSFSYQHGESDVLKDLSLRFEGGKRTALVGRSGAGKSTIVKLLLGIVPPTSGKVTADGQDLASVRLDTYFPHVGYLPQEPSVFDGTIRENLAYGMSGEVSDDALWQALRHARCDFAERMEAGLETEI